MTHIDTSEQKAFALHHHRALAHYIKAREKHPYFCDRMLPAWAENNKKVLINRALEDRRAYVQNRAEYGMLRWDNILDCEVWEAHQAIANGDTSAAVDELYDCVAVLLRTIDVLEGRQPLGKPKKEGGEK